LNPRGEVPVLEDGGTVVWDSAACLAYVARKHGGEQWLPADPAGMAQVMQWMALAGDEVQVGLQDTRPRGRQKRWTAGNLGAGAGAGAHRALCPGGPPEDERLARARPAHGSRRRVLSVHGDRAGSESAARALPGDHRVARALQGAARLGRA